MRLAWPCFDLRVTLHSVWIRFGWLAGWLVGWLVSSSFFQVGLWVGLGLTWNLINSYLIPWKALFHSSGRGRSRAGRRRTANIAKHGNNQTKLRHSKGAEKRPPRSHWSKYSTRCRSYGAKLCPRRDVYVSKPPITFKTVAISPTCVKTSRLPSWNELICCFDVKKMKYKTPLKYYLAI